MLNRFDDRELYNAVFNLQNYSKLIADTVDNNAEALKKFIKAANRRANGQTFINLCIFGAAAGAAVCLLDLHDRVKKLENKDKIVNFNEQI